MKIVTRDDIERWADRIDSKSDLPYLISRLVRATTPGSTQVDFPSGTATYIGGWDGVVNCQEDTAYIPRGISLYELGTESNCKSKADKDYEKRTANSLGYDQKDCVFIFITLRFWKKKDEWIREKQKEGIWKDVKVYDSSTLEQWLDIAQTVQRWFANKIKGIPYDGIDLADEYWKYWSIFEKLKLTPEVIASGREKEQAEILRFLQGPASIMSVKAASKEEAIAFIIATAKLFPESESERFFSKTLIIHSEGNYKSYSTNSISPLNLIPTFENRLPLYSAVSNNHHVIVPLGADDDFNQNTLQLPIIDREGQINGLIASGLLKEDAEKFSRESGRNITVLKRLLNFPHNKAKWLNDAKIREIIPALLIGRWNENFPGDINLIEKLSEQKYSDYLIHLNKWKNYEESPLIQIGQTWRLTSPLDLWTNLSQYLTPKDFQLLNECFSFAFESGNPLIEPKDSTDLINIYNKNRVFSNWSREGLTQSLILIGWIGEGINLANLPSPQNWVDKIIHDLLNTASGERWISIDHELPLIAEASPQSFIRAVNESLNRVHPEILDMFKEVDGFLYSGSNHTGLLWALEGLAWLPEYLKEISLILLKLSRLDPGGKIMNRPINSIVEIFKPWHYQTLASYVERMEVLKYITEKERETGWTLLIRMLPEHHGIGHPTQKMRWRIFDKNTNPNYTYHEIWKTHSYVIERLIILFDNDENKFSQLINASVNLSPKDRKRVFDWANIHYAEVQQIKYSTWETIRKILNHHRSHSKTDWALPESELLQYESLYEKLEPSDVINKYVWLFNDHWPAFPEGFRFGEDTKGYEEQQIKINKKRIEVVKIFLTEVGLEKTIELRKVVKESWCLGEALSEVLTDQKQIILVCQCLYDDKDTIRFVHGFIYQKWKNEGLEWIISLLATLKQKNFSSKALQNLLLPLYQSKQLWDLVSELGKDIQNEYWQNVNPTFFNIPDDEKIFGIKMLIKYKRFFSAIEICSHFPDTIPTGILVELLTNSATISANEPIRYEGYSIERIFKTLDSRSDLPNHTLITLEWLYLPLLNSYGITRNPKNLEEELAKNPDFFVEVLSLVYKAENNEKSEEGNDTIPEESIKNRASQAYLLLHSWKKIPGMQSDYSIDEHILKDWIYNARKLAKENNRLDVADMHIGQVLAQFPEDNQLWPSEIIFKVIEELNSDSLNNNYSTAMFNKRGSSTRGPFDGGTIEREHASYFEKLANDFKVNYPIVSDIFRKLSKGYLRDAKRMDDQATRDRLEY